VKGSEAVKNAFKLIQPAFEKMRELLFPINVKLWLKLAFIALIAGFGMGGGFNGSNYNQRQLSNEKMSEISAAILGIWTRFWKAIVAIVIVLLLLWVLMAFLSSVFKFIFYDGMTKKETGMRASFKRNLELGASLFGFMLIFGIVILLLVILLVAPIIFSLCVHDIGNISKMMPNAFGFVFVSFCFLCCLIIPLLLITLLIIEDFTIPIMFLGRKGFLSSTSHALRLISGNLLQFFFYIAAKLVLGIVCTIISFLLLLPLLIVLLIIFILVYFTSLQGFNFSAMTMRDVGIGIVLLIPAFLLISYLAQLLTLPVTVFSRFFPLMFLRELDPDLNFEQHTPSQ
jgi:hypothetical protein